jgi:hypothetical protein
LVVHDQQQTLDHCNLKLLEPILVVQVSVACLVAVKTHFRHLVVRSLQKLDHCRQQFHLGRRQRFRRRLFQSRHPSPLQLLGKPHLSRESRLGRVVAPLPAHVLQKAVNYHESRKGLCYRIRNQYKRHLSQDLLSSLNLNLFRNLCQDPADKLRKDRVRDPKINLINSLGLKDLVRNPRGWLDVGMIVSRSREDYQKSKP